MPPPSTGALGGVCESTTEHERPSEIVARARRELATYEQQVLACTEGEPVTVQLDINKSGEPDVRPGFLLPAQPPDVRMVEIYRHGRRVASHPRDDTPYQPTTAPRHRPPNHRAVFEGTRDRLMQWAREVGPSTTELMERLLDPHHNFAGNTRRRSGHGVRRLEDKYERARIEQACERVLAFERVSYKSVERILRLGLDQAPAPRDTTPEAPAIEHDQVRGADYFADDEEEDNHAA